MRMRTTARFCGVAVVLVLMGGCRSTDNSQPEHEQTPATTAAKPQQVAESLAMGGAKSVMTFFVTSNGSGKGGDLGGLAGADAHCTALAKAEGAGDHTWRAYLSTSAAAGQPAVNVRDRIGNGPWYNSGGDLIATTLEQLHGPDSKLDKA